MTKGFEERDLLMSDFANAGMVTVFPIEVKPALVVHVSF